MATPAARKSPSRLLLVAAVCAVVIAAALVFRLSSPLASNAGSDARDFASSAYPKLFVEVDWVVEGGTSYQPSTNVLSLLEQRLNERLTKPGGITVSFGNAITTSKTAFTVDDLRILERDNRATHTGGDTAAMWIVFANAYSEGGSGGGSVIGIAYSGSSAAVFLGTIKAAATFLVPEDSIARIATVHEVGHLLGLVNHGTPMVTAHEDTAHPGHSVNPDSVMYWQAEGTGLVGHIAGGNNPDNFDGNDIADLRAIGGK